MRYLRWANRNRDWLLPAAAIVLMIVTFVIVLGVVADQRRFSAELRDGLVASCERNGNPLREAVQGQIRKQIKQRKTFDYDRFFPNIPETELAALLEQQNEADRATLKQIAPVDCASLYPRP